MLQGRLKLREFSDGTAELIYYERFDKAGPKTSKYTRAQISDAASTREVLGQVLETKVVVAKRHEVFLAGRTCIHLDEVDGLGMFVELEVVLGSDLGERRRVISQKIAKITKDNPFEMEPTPGTSSFAGAAVEEDQHQEIGSARTDFRRTLCDLCDLLFKMFSLVFLALGSDLAERRRVISQKIAKITKTIHSKWSQRPGTSSFAGAAVEEDQASRDWICADRFSTNPL